MQLAATLPGTGAELGWRLWKAAVQAWRVDAAAIDLRLKDTSSKEFALVFFVNSFTKSCIYSILDRMIEAKYTHVKLPRCAYPPSSLPLGELGY